MRQSLIMAHGSFETFFTRPISGTIMVLALVLLIWPLARVIYRRIQA
jgi:putative tricarboxylic transport membrane protein